MNKRWLILATLAVLGAGLGQAQVFTWPQKWTVAKPGEATPGGVLVGSTISDFRTLNPFTTAEATNIPTIMANGVGLARYDPTTAQQIPWMSTGWTVSNNGLVFTFDIRKGMKFSDGQPITSKDFITTWKIQADEKVGSNAYDGWYIADKPIILKALGDYKLQATFPSISATALEQMSFTPWPDHIFGPVYAKEGADGIKKMWSLTTPPAQIVSAGPFVLSGYRPGERAEFKKNPYYGEWNKDEQGNPLPYLDGQTVLIVKDTNADLAAFLSGKTDTYAPSTVDQVSQVKQAIGAGNLKATLKVNASPVASSQFIVFNWNKADNPFLQMVFRNVSFRRAMSELTDRKAAVDLVYGGLGFPTYGSVYPVLKQWVDPNIPRYEYDPKAAAQLLASIGFRSKDKDGWLVYSGSDKQFQGKRLEFTLTTNTGNNQREQLAQLFAKTAKEAGVKVNFAPVDFNTLVGQLLAKGDNRPFDAILIGLSGGGLAWPFGQNVVPCGTNLHMYNKSGSCLTPQETLMTALYFKGNQTLDFKQRVQIGYQLQQTEAQLQPIIYIAGPAYNPAWNDRTGGNHPDSILTATWGSRETELTFIKK
ncbi:MAG: ABC transporter substrate-binding protein [Thermaceae bacterium]|nr:ABC transporter substrate-binding protein [Thermaceae bacterium]